MVWDDDGCWEGWVGMGVAMEVEESPKGGCRGWNEVRD